MNKEKEIADNFIRSLVGMAEKYDAPENERKKIVIVGSTTKMPGANLTSGIKSDGLETHEHRVGVSVIRDEDIEILRNSSLLRLEIGGFNKNMRSDLIKATSSSDDLLRENISKQGENLYNSEARITVAPNENNKNKLNIILSINMQNIKSEFSERDTDNFMKIAGAILPNLVGNVKYEGLGHAK